MSEWGVPDWRARAEYKKLKSLTMRQWAWEFLRRNHDYRTFWRETIAPVCDDSGAIDDGKLQAALNSYDGKDWEELCARMKRQHGCDWEPFVQTQSPETWGLLSAADPRKSDGWRLIQTFTGDPLHWRDAPELVSPWAEPIFGTDVLRASPGAGKHTVTLAPEEMAIVFDLSRPLDGQLTAARRAMIERAARLGLKQSAPRRRTDKYPLYLRLLDAVDAGIAAGRIAKELFSDKSNEYPDYQQRQTFKNHAAQAERLRERGYRLLAIAGRSDVIPRR
jgi:Family of unknown function (DUF6499)/Uncharacterized conserved protein (DUF2285)